MNEFLNRILELPRQQKLGILAGVIILLLFFDYFFLYTRFSFQISDLKQSVELARTERDRKKALVANLPQLKQQIVLLNGMLNEAIAQLPDQKEIPDLLANISSKARESGLDILLFRPRAENPQDFYAEIPVDVVVRGEFHSVVGFFDEVGRLNRLVNINNIEMKNPKVNQEQVTIDTATLVTTFRFLDEAERAKIAAEKAAKEKAAKK
ncbi:MAG TPA: type 4a pilus biogenesis protein PilO [Candidatus Binatia bacterium]|jgi:type IV pilus assembly protein PilO